jgi:8-oxo-dGTP pyrophosphatase MutT (NUDIX family)
VAKYFFETENPPRKGVETVRRKTIHAIVRRKTDGNILMLEWKANQRKDGSFPYTFVIGGVEEGEDMVEAARRELEEEVGIVDAVFIKQLSFAVQTEYFAGHKNQNRYSEITVLYFEVDGDKHREIAEEELQKHMPRWVPEEEVADTINIIDGPYIWQQFLHPTALTEKGIVCNSDFLNDASSNIKSGKDNLIKLINKSIKFSKLGSSL